MPKSNPPVIEPEAYKEEQQPRMSVLWVVTTAVIGLALAACLVCAFMWVPALHGMANRNPPWLLLSSAAAAPTLLYLWMRRDRHRRVEQWLKNRELNLVEKERTWKENEAASSAEKQREDRLDTEFEKALLGLHSDWPTGQWLSTYALESVAYRRRTLAPRVIRELKDFIARGPSLPENKSEAEVVGKRISDFLEQNGMDNADRA